MWMVSSSSITGAKNNGDGRISDGRARGGATTKSAPSSPNNYFDNYCSPNADANNFACNWNHRSQQSGRRWKPSGKQVEALEELYERGMRRPSPQQILHIAAKLAEFGNIEGKNVFYWFQNHKRRRRRLLINSTSHAQTLPTTTYQQGARKTDLQEDGGTKKCATHSFSTFSEVSDDIINTSAVLVAGSRRSDDIGWTRFADNTSIKQLDYLSSSSDSSNSFSSSYKRLQEFPGTTPRLIPSVVATSNHGILVPTHIDFNLVEVENEGKEIQILQLFPLHEKNDESTINGDNKECSLFHVANGNGNPRQFYDFLPVKN